MAKLDFPGSPTPSQKYPSPAVAGQPVYTWDGEKWTSIASTYIPGTASFEAMAYSGMQINGGMEVSQEIGTTITPIPTNSAKYGPDGFIGECSGSSLTVQQNPIASLPGYSFAFQLNGTNTISAAGDRAIIHHRIEGYRCQRLAFGTVNAQPVTISFWIYSTVTGSMAVSIRSNTMTYITDIPITVANSWQYKTVTIPGATTGTWGGAQNSGMSIGFCFGGGSTHTAAANSWLTSNAFASSTTTNFFATSSTTYITGVTILPGTQAPTAAQSPNIMRPYGQELMTCQRYYIKKTADGVAAAFASGYCYNTTLALFSLNYLMRSAPTLAFGPAMGDMGVGISGVTPSALGISIIASNSTMRAGITTSANLVAGQGALLVAQSAQTYLSLDARL